MAVGFYVDPCFYLIGSGDFLNSFFSTIYIKLEDSFWGSKYPLIMNELYNGRLEKDNVPQAQKELQQIKEALAKLPPTEVVWDFEDLSLSPPWGNDISEEITNMAEYFVTSDGKNLIDVLEKALKTAIELEDGLSIDVL